MVYDYAVKHNGIFYPAGANVPVEGDSVTEIKTEPKVEVTPKEEPKPKVTPKRKTKK